VRGDWGGADMGDLMAVVDQLVAAGDIDGDRLYVTGGSYGGFMTSWIVGHTDRFQAASAVVPVTNLVSFYGTSDIGWWFAPGEVGPDLWEDPQRLWKQSPLAYAPNIRTPTQVMAGEDDQRCPIEQAEQLYVALKRFGVDTEFLRYPGSHGFGALSKPTLRQDRLRRLLEWFRTHP
jgi:dipeptidyl aminopeptidase/acylaminoacyl peptidase